jgi:hypothetical protein
MYFSFDRLSRGSTLGSCNALFLLPPYVKHLATPTMLIGKIRGKPLNQTKYDQAIKRHILGFI